LNRSIKPSPKLAQNFFLRYTEESVLSTHVIAHIYDSKSLNPDRIRTTMSVAAPANFNAEEADNLEDVKPSCPVQCLKPRI